MSSVTYRYEQSYGFKKKGVKHSIKEQVIDGPEGVSVMYLRKEGEEDFYKLYAKADAGSRQLRINRHHAYPGDGYNPPPNTTLILTEIAQ